MRKLLTIALLLLSLITSGQQQWFVFQLRVDLEGPYKGSTGLMNDDLRQQGLVPLTEPYTNLGYPQVGNGGSETTTPQLLTTSGTMAVVDWVYLELRNANHVVVATRCALLRRNGDVVMADSSGAVVFPIPESAPYYVVVYHRNHLPAASLYISQFSMVDMSLVSTQVWGDGVPNQQPMAVLGNGKKGLWSGNVNGDLVVKYTGASNDRDPVLVSIGGTVPTNTMAGYSNADVNMDGVVKYTGASNDRDPILVNIGGTIPTGTRSAILPWL